MKWGRIRDKNAMSDIVVTSIFVLLVIVAVGIIWFSVKGIIDKNTEDIEIKSALLKVNIEITNFQVLGEEVKVSINRKLGGGDISGLKFIFSDGFKTSTFNEELSNFGVLNTRVFTLPYKGLVKSIKVFPYITASSERIIHPNIFAEIESSSRNILENMGAIYWWNFEGDAIDSIGNNIGTIFGDTFISDRNVQFDGDSDYIDTGISTRDITLFTNPFSIEVRFKINGTTGSIQTIINNRVDANNDFTISVASGLTEIRAGGSDENRRVGYTTNLNTDTWYHALYTWDLSQAKLYLNQQDVFTSASVYGGTNTNFRIGGRENDRWFNGTIDFVRAYNRALSQAEVSGLYELELSNGLINN